MAGFFTGMPEQTKQFQRFTPQQQGLQNNILGQLSSLLQQGQGGNNFEPIEQKARQDFAQKTVPSIAERFTSLGAQGSSGFANTLGQAGAGLETNLAAMRAGNQQNQLSQLLSYGFQPSFENLYQPETQGLFGGAAQGVGQGIGSLLPALLSAGLSGAAGANPYVAAGSAGLSGLLALLSYLRGQ